MEQISGVYKILNTVTGDFYIGSSRNVMRRWAEHKSPSRWKRCPDNRLYQDFQKYGLDKFKFQILISIMPECRKQVEQDCIELMKPTYNNYNAKGWDIGRQKESQKKYWESEKGRKCQKKYANKLCSYNGETLTLDALRCRFRKAGVEHPTLEAKKYLLNQQ